MTTFLDPGFLIAVMVISLGAFMFALEQLIVGRRKGRR